MPEVTCKWPNVWTSDGRKLLKGDTVDVSDDDAKALKDCGAVEMKRGRKKETEDGA